MSFNFPPPSPAEASADPLAPPMPVCDSRRPRLLLCAARHGLSLYRRDRDLPRLMARASGQRPLDLLTEAEARAALAYLTPILAQGPRAAWTASIVE